MRYGKVITELSMVSLLGAGVFLGGVSAVAQTKPATVSDAQIEANVLKALAGKPQLADQTISTTTVYGTVTISGSVRDEASRDMAEDVVSKAIGVQKVVDELTIGGNSPAVADANGNANTGVPTQDSTERGTNPNLQSDGTIAPPTSAEQPQPMQGQQDMGYGAQPQQDAQNQQPQQPMQEQPIQQQPVPQQQPMQQQPMQQQPMQQQPMQEQPIQQQPMQQPVQPGPYGTYQQPYSRAYAQPPVYVPAQPMVQQRGGDAVIVPAGSIIRVRMNQGMDSRKTAPGTGFDGVVLNDVLAGGAIAIPRGAMVQGVVSDVHNAGQLRGRGGLALQLTQVTLGDTTYPLVSDYWSSQGADKTGATVSNTVGLSALGAVIGAVAGGGVGAAVGAGVGGVAGLGLSSATGRGDAMIPAEAIVSFRLTQPMELTTVSQAELNRLGAGLPPPVQQQQPQAQQLQRRYPYGYPPPPPPGYYYPQYYRY